MIELFFFLHVESSFAIVSIPFILFSLQLRHNSADQTESFEAHSQDEYR